MSRRIHAGSLNRGTLAAAVAACFATAVHANPTGPTVTTGSATFSTLGNTLTITNVPGTIIQWNGFSIQANEITRFLQQNSNSAVLNRVTGGNMSQLMGQLLSNGRVFLINPSGIVIGQGAVIDVAALVATSLNLSDKDFLAGRYRFTGREGAGSIVNQGTLTTASGGFVYLVAPNVENHGIIRSPNGEVILAAGKTVELVNASSPQLRVEIDAPEGEAVNLGSIISQAGRVGIYGASIRNTGRVSANSAVVGENGKIIFKATKDVTLADGSRVEATSSAGKGGSVEVQGDKVALTGDASIDVSGKTGGGSVLIGGDYRGANPDVQNASGTFIGAGTSIRADALESGDGGRVIAWSNEATRVHGSISARGAGGGSGGFVETSSKGYLEVTNAPSLGAGGTWLLDPYNIEVVADGTGNSNNDGAPTFTPNGDDSKIEARFIVDQLNASTSVILDTGGAGSPGTQAGNIAVNAGILKLGTNTASLTLNANNNVDINAPINTSGGTVNVTAGGDMAVKGFVSSTGMSINLGGGLSVVGTSTGVASLSSTNGQSITAKSVLVSAEGSAAQIVNQAGNQAITVNGGGTSPGIDVQGVLAPSPGGALITSIGSQTITVTDADHIRVDASATSASINAAGPQTISISGSGRNRIDVGSASANAVSQIAGRTQNITAGLLGQQGGINIFGANVANLSGANSVGIVNLNAPGSGWQSVSTSGVLNVTGGTAVNVGTAVSNAGVVNNSTAGDQTVTASGIALAGGSSGGGNVALISSARHQTISGDPDITVTADAGGNATIIAASSTSPTPGVQTISAHDITLAGGTGGLNAAATIVAPHQTITATGSVKLKGEAAAVAPGSLGGVRIGGNGGATDLTLHLTGSGNLTLEGGTAQGNAAAIGSSGAGTQFANDITITTANGGKVILTGGSGTNSAARIGTAPAQTAVGGNISIIASGDLQLNGGGAPASIRTTGDLGLSAASASESGNAFVAANKLTLNVTGNADLGGGNQVTTLSAPDVAVPPAPPRPGVQGSLTFSNSAGLNVADTVSSGGLMKLTVAGALNVNGNGSAARVTSGGGQDITAQSINLTAQNAGTATIENRGGAQQKLTATAGGMNLQALSGSGVAQIINSAAGASQTLSMSGLLNVLGGASGGTRNSGVFQNTSGPQSVTSSGITLQASATGGALITVQGGGDQNIDAGTGSILQTAGSGGSLNNASINTTTGNQRVRAASISLVSGSGGSDNSATMLAASQDIATTGDVSLAGGTATGTLSGARIGGVGGTSPTNTDLTLSVGGNLHLTGGDAAGNGSSIGSSVAGLTQTSNLRITATGDVILDSGSAAGVRIGGTSNAVTPPPGDISITARSIQLNGSAQPTLIRTGGDVKLSATTTISEGAQGFIEAGKLTLKSGGDATLGGNNKVTTLSAPDVLVVTNPPPAPPTVLPGVGGKLTFNNNAALGVTDTVSSGSGMDITVAGGLTVSSATNLAELRNLAGNQAITVTGGSGIDVTSGAFGAQIVNLGAGTQTIKTVDADHISVNGASNFASLSALGAQKISLEGASSANALKVGGAGALSGSVVSGFGQDITAGKSGQQGSITVTGPDSNSATAFIVAQATPGGSQTLSTNGQLAVNGGKAPNHTTIGTANSGVFNNSTGLQHITAGSVSLTGGSVGANNTALITSTAAAPGNQLVETGALNITGGSGAGGGNTASITAGGSATQTIQAGAVTLQAGSAGNNSAFITAGFNGGGLLGNQNIAAQSISLSGDTSGINAVALIQAPHQNITTTGNVTLEAKASGVTLGSLAGARIGGNGGATDLTMTVGGDLKLTGGTAQDNAAAIGSSGAGTAFDNRIIITTGAVTGAGNVILNGGSMSGAVARIGTDTAQAAAAGDISITATGGSIQLNGGSRAAAVRTTGNVTLSAGTAIGEDANGFIEAARLTLRAGGDANLGGLNNKVTTLSAPGVAVPPAPPLPGVQGSLTFNNSTALNVADTVSSGGLMKLTVAGALNVNGNGATDARLISSGGQDITARSVSLTAQNDRRSTIENSGGTGQKITATAGGIDLQALGGSGVAQIVNSAPGAAQTLSMTGLLNVLGGMTTRGDRYSGVFQSAAADQRVTSSGVVLQSSPTGNNPATPSGAVIDSSTGGDQLVDAGAGDISLTAAAGVRNNAAISGLGRQTIAGRNISLTNGVGGTNSVAAITAPHQVITAAGDVALTSQSSSAADGLIPGVRIGGNGGATDLELHAANVTLTGGTAPNNGAGIGSSAVGASFDNTISITVAGNVVLNGGSDPGTGARIGTAGATGQPVAGGNISIGAGGEIRLNGTAAPAAIRTTGDVSLAAASITEGPNGLILANTLTTATSGDTSLTGPNRAASYSGRSTGGSITLNNAGPLVVQAIDAANAALITASSVHGSGAISTGGGFTVSVTDASELGGIISGADGLTKNGGGFLTLGAVNTYTGDTNVNAGTLALAAPDQTTTGNINIAAGATFRGSPGTYNNAGVIAGGGTLDVEATSFTNTGTLRPGGAGAIGTLTVQGDAVLNGLLDIEAAGTAAGQYDVLAVTGAATLGGALNVTPINGYAPQAADTIAPLTFASRSGTLNVATFGWFGTYNPGYLTLDYGVEHWVGTSGDWSAASNWSLGRVPNALDPVVVDVPGSQFITVSGGAQAAARLASSENFIVSGGSLSLGGASSFNGSLSLLGGELRGAGDVTVNGAFIWTGGRLGGTGSFLTSAGTVALLAPLGGDLVLDRGWINQGTINWLNPLPRSIVGGGSLQNQGTLNVAGWKASIGTGFANFGTLNLFTDLELKLSADNRGLVNLGEGTGLKVYGTYTNFGRLTGSGTVDTSGGELVNLGSVAPGGNSGSGIGRLRISGDFRQGASGVLEIDLGGTRIGEYDALDVTGKATLAGTLFTRAANGYLPRDGDEFRLVSYKSRVGTFDTVLAPNGSTLEAEYARKFASFELE